MNDYTMQDIRREYNRRMKESKQGNIGTDIFSADQVIGKTLIAKSNVPLKRYAQAGAPVVYTAKPGQVVGTVYSWVMDGPTLWWAFYDDKNQPYYAQHKVGIFSVEALQQQGAQTLEDIKEAADAAANPVSTSIMKAVKPITIAIAAYVLIRAFRD